MKRLLAPSGQRATGEREKDFADPWQRMKKQVKLRPHVIAKNSNAFLVYLNKMNVAVQEEQRALGRAIKERKRFKKPVGFMKHERIGYRIPPRRTTTKIGVDNDAIFFLRV
eukprot:GEMP01143104.1.p3 GENE.GEMP01143104.1~~GEMP01143104.1.p3  ORF type:complete len:111 (-),score=19.70 GEMP01143104.1:23-355(-)